MGQVPDRSLVPVFTAASKDVKAAQATRHTSPLVYNKKVSDVYDELSCNAQGWLMFIMTSRWFTQRLDLMTSVFAIITLFAPIIAANHLGMSELAYT